MDVVCVRYVISVNACGTVDDDDNDDNSNNNNDDDDDDDDIIVAVLITFGNLVETRRFSVFFFPEIRKTAYRGWTQT